MRLLKAVYAFYASLLSRDCEHKRMDLHKKSGYCPDCGYQVLLLWAFVRCRTCGSKRLPKQSLDGKIGPMYRYCQHCGGVEHQVIKKDKINAHEMIYAISIKEIDYTEHKDAAQQIYAQKPGNPFENACQAFNVVEGEVIRSY